MTQLEQIEEIQIQADDWEPYGALDPYSRLATTIVVNGTFLHLEAIEVMEENGIQVGKEKSEVGEEYFELLSATFEPDGGFATAEINGRTYCLFAFPFGR